jgi:P-type E1-E2 ATPase
LAGILLYLVLLFFKEPTLALLVILLSIAIGSIDLIKETVASLLKRQYALDYIAILAVLVAVATQEYLVGAVIALMLSSGRTLEEYGVSQARKSLTSLVNRIPDEVLLSQNGQAGDKVKIASVKIGQSILIRKGEVVPLDGTLESSEALLDESSLTGEPYMGEKQRGDLIRSGTVNQGDLITISVTNEEKDSTYKKIISMVEKAEGEKPPLVRLADKYSTIFTLVTFVIAGFAYVSGGGSIERILAVLVVATPCPLILATPIALMGGVNRAAKRRIIIKQFAALETLSRVNSLVFDKTGTITLGKPVLETITCHIKSVDEKNDAFPRSCNRAKFASPLGKSSC